MSDPLPIPADAAPEQPNETQILEEAAAQVNLVPVTIHVNDGQSKCFIVPGIGCWKYEQFGIFATGYWYASLDQSEKDVLIPYDRINWLEFDFDALNTYLDTPTELEEAEAV